MIHIHYLVDGVPYVWQFPIKDCVPDIGFRMVSMLVFLKLYGSTYGKFEPLYSLWPRQEVVH